MLLQGERCAQFRQDTPSASYDCWRSVKDALQDESHGERDWCSTISSR